MSRVCIYRRAFEFDSSDFNEVCWDFKYSRMLNVYGATHEKKKLTSCQYYTHSLAVWRDFFFVNFFVVDVYRRGFWVLFCRFYCLHLILCLQTILFCRSSLKQYFCCSFVSFVFDGTHNSQSSIWTKKKFLNILVLLLLKKFVFFSFWNYSNQFQTIIIKPLQNVGVSCWINNSVEIFQ